MSKYLQWLKNQCVNGMVCVHDTAADAAGRYQMVEPYFASQGLYWAFQASPQALQTEVAAWLNWWFARRDAATGSTLRHYLPVQGQRTATTHAKGLPARHEDATDSNIAMWYLLLRAFLARYGHAALSEDLRTRVHEPLLALMKLYMPDGMTWAKASWQVKYLMDNVEVWAGLQATVDVLRHFGGELNAHLLPLAEYLARQVGDAIRAMYDAASQQWACSKQADGALVWPNMRTGYPDLNAQIWPAMYGFDARGGFPVVERACPHWRHTRVSPDSTADVHIALGAKLAGRHAEVAQWLALVAPGFDNGASFHWPFTCGEAGLMHYIVAG
ncbi:MAG: hypothetical protein Q4D74_09305 [Comamonadaceae bacterium]|nr:hypothetical protein [Comamonadaceae bacterium]RRD57044.1 hypothetical protein EII20_08630 [Comamonadaceae bacterium OH2545_COT-014]